MSDNLECFSQEYESQEQTKLENNVESIVAEEKTCDNEYTKYGISKPKRIIIKAVLINDKDSF